jgi:hypothetical protein
MRKICSNISSQNTFLLVINVVSNFVIINSIYSGVNGTGNYLGECLILIFLFMILSHEWLKHGQMLENISQYGHKTVYSIVYSRQERQ